MLQEMFGKMKVVCNALVLVCTSITDSTAAPAVKYS